MADLAEHIWGHGPGWLLAELGSVHVGYADARAGEEAQLAYLKCQERAIEAAYSAGRRRCVLNHSPSPRNMTAKARKEFGEMLKARQHELARTVSLFVLVTPSSMVRGISTAVLWLAPPPYKHAIEATPRAGFEAMLSEDPDIDVELYLEAYQRLLLRYVPDIKLGAFL